MSSFFSEHWFTVLLALAACIFWTLGNKLQKKPLVYIGIALCVFALLSYTSVFSFLGEL